MVISKSWFQEYRKSLVEVFDDNKIDALTVFGASAIMAEIIPFVPKNVLNKFLKEKYGEEKFDEHMDVLIRNVNFINGIVEQAASNADIMFPKSKQQDEFLSNMKNLIGDN